LTTYTAVVLVFVAFIIAVVSLLDLVLTKDHLLGIWVRRISMSIENPTFSSEVVEEVVPTATPVVDAFEAALAADATREGL
jgi:hypothetical protein